MSLDFKNIKTLINYKHCTILRGSMFTFKTFLQYWVLVCFVVVIERLQIHIFLLTDCTYVDLGIHTVLVLVDGQILRCVEPLAAEMTMIYLSIMSGPLMPSQTAICRSSCVDHTTSSKITWCKYST